MEPLKPNCKTKSSKHASHHFSLSLSWPRHVYGSNYQHMPTTWWLKVMQMQLNLICIQQHLTDAVMADGYVPAIFGIGKDWQPFCLMLCPSENNHTASLWRQQQLGSWGCTLQPLLLAGKAFKANHIYSHMRNQDSLLWKIHTFRITLKRIYGFNSTGFS